MATMCSLCGNIYEHYHNCLTGTAPPKFTDTTTPTSAVLEARVAELERRVAMMADNVEALRRTTFHAARVAKKATR